MGCIALPYATPPVRMTVGGGVPVSNDVSPRGTFAFRAGINPQQLVGRPAERAFDLGLGYHFDTSHGDADLLHGPYAEGSWIFTRHDFDSTQLRLLGSAFGEMMITRSSGFTEFGGGGTAMFSVEFAGATVGTIGDGDTGQPNGEPAPAAFSETGQDSAIIGVAIGEWAIGAYAAVGARYIGDDFAFLIHGGLAVRLPASIGVLIVPIPL